LASNSLLQSRNSPRARKTNSPPAPLSAREGSKDTGARKYFLDYQLRWLADYSKVKIWEKSRRIGATYVQSYEDVRDIISHREYTPTRPVRKVFFTSADESAAREYIEYCAMWAKIANVVAESIGEVMLDSENDIKALCIDFKDGGKIYALTSNPKRFRSKGGKVVWDEAAWHDDQAAMWKAAQPTAMWGYPIRILSTHHGRQCLFYQFCRDTESGKTGWSRHVVTIVDAVNDGLVDKIYGRSTNAGERKAFLDELHANCRSEDVWQEEYMCNAVDAATAFLPFEIIAGAEAPKLIMTIDELMNLDEGDLYGGWDVARSRDMSVFWLLQKLGDVRYTRLTRSFEKTRFAIQLDFLESFMKLPRLRRLCIDKTGMGIPLEEQAREKYGASRIEGVTFTNAVKEALAADAKNALEDKRSRIPEETIIRESFHSIRRIVTAAGNTRYDADATEATGHADHFWAFALAEHAAKGPGGPIFVITRDKSRRRQKITAGY
jgi:phage FluMu gp28-like protein